MKKLIIVLPILFIAVMIACRKEQPQMPILNENCECAHEVSAEFLMEELASQIGGKFEDKLRTDTDTIYSDRNLRFHALEDNAEYTWYVGTEVITEQTFYRYFDESLVGQTLTLSLVVKKEPNNICYPNDDGYDSIARNLFVSEKLNSFNFYNNYQWRFEGSYRMNDVNLKDTDSIDVQCRLGTGTNHFGEPIYDVLVITNFKGDGDSIYFGPGEPKNYRCMWIGGNYCYTNSKYTGFFHYKLDNSFEISLTASDISDECEDVILKGRKLN